MQIDTLPVEQVFSLQDDLNAQKKILQKKQNLAKDPSQYAQEWLELAGKYALIDSKANAGYCMDRYRHFAGQKLETVGPAPVMLFEEPEVDKSYFPEVELPDDEFDWQSREDVGD